MEKQYIVGLIGLSDSGKGEVLKILQQLAVEKNILPFKELSFAASLKQVCADIYDLDLEKFTDKKYRDYTHRHLAGRTVREVLQNVGERLRKLDKNIWIKDVEKEIIYSEEKCNYVVSDVRYENEIQILHEFTFDTWFNKDFKTVFWDVQRDINLTHLYPFSILNEIVNTLKLDKSKEELYNYISSLLKNTKYAHESELNYWFNRDYANAIIDNNGTLNDLKAQVEEKLNQLLETN